MERKKKNRLKKGVEKHFKGKVGDESIFPGFERESCSSSRSRKIAR
jgi:hypothetical protein